MVYGVLRGGSVLHGRGIGVSALPTGAAPGLDTVFRIASMTKSFTAATLLGLRDDGLLDLDAAGRRPTSPSWLRVGLPPSRSPCGTC